VNDDGPPDLTLPPSAYVRMSGLLRLGLGISLGLLIVALIAYLLVHPSETSAHAIATNPILSFLNAGGLAQGLVTGNAAAFGLLVLGPLVR
jgi:hypothetical protein